MRRAIHSRGLCKRGLGRKRRLVEWKRRWRLFRRLIGRCPVERLGRAERVVERHWRLRRVIER
jgi:hypothetical protein